MPINAENLVKIGQSFCDNFPPRGRLRKKGKNTKHNIK